MQKQIILFASIFAVICASKDQITDGTLIGAESAIASNHIYSQPMQDNVAAESEVSKRGAAVVSTSTATSSSNENQGQSSQIDVGKWPKIVMIEHSKSFGFVDISTSGWFDGIFTHFQVQTQRRDLAVCIVLAHQIVSNNFSRQHSDNLDNSDNSEEVEEHFTQLH